MQSTTLNKPDGAARPSYRRLALVSLGTGLVAAVSNTLVFYLGEAANLIPKGFVFSGSNQPLSAGLVASFSFMGVLTGGAILAALTRFSRRPIQLFWLISLGFLALFAVAPLTLGAALSLVGLLELMHLVAGGIALVGLTRFAFK